MPLPLVLSVSQLSDQLMQLGETGQSLADVNLLLVDLRSTEEYQAGHIPGAVHGNAAYLNRSAHPVGGLCPEPESINRFLREIGARPGDHIIAYDAGRQTSAARMIWVLDAYGYEASSWLNGGYAAWQQGQHRTSTETGLVVDGTLTVQLIGENLISVDELMGKLGADDEPFIIDTRSAAEFSGTDVRSAHGGHVPGARHLDWLNLLDENGLLLEDTSLESLLSSRTGDPEEAVVVYCQTHQRSAVAYVALRHLGYRNVSAIDGAWSNWGNRADTPKA